MNDRELDLDYDSRVETWTDEQIAAADDDVPQEDILAALRDSLPDGYVSWVDIKAQYKEIMSER